MTTTEFSYSAFLRAPTVVLPALERGDVRLERRDGDDLVMSRAGRYSAAQQGIALASRMMRSLAKEQPDLAEALLAAELPWLSWMPRSEQMDCIPEILNNLAAGAETGTFEPLARSILEWEHTAEVWADPQLARRLTSSFPGDGEEITRPQVHK